MVAAADLRLAEAGVPNPPRHADISRSDLSQPLHPDPRRAEKGAVGLRGGCVTPRATTRRVDRGISSIWSLSASGPPRLRIALCRGIGKETFLPERTTRTPSFSTSYSTRRPATPTTLESGFGDATATGTGGRDQVELTGGSPLSSRNRAAPSPNLLPLGAARQTAFMCARAQSAKFVNPPGTRALAAAMYRSCSGPKYVCSAKYWNISRISWAPG